MNDKFINNIFDKAKDTNSWIDLMIFRIWMVGSIKDQMPIEWGRERMKKLVDRIKNNKINF